MVHICVPKGTWFMSVTMYGVQVATGAIPSLHSISVSWRYFRYSSSGIFISCQMSGSTPPRPPMVGTLTLTPSFTARIRSSVSMLRGKPLRPSV